MKPLIASIPGAYVGVGGVGVRMGGVGAPRREAWPVCKGFPSPSVIIRFETLNLRKVCASLVDFHFRCCQLKGIWTNQYLSVFSHTESWLLEKRGLQQTQPIPLALALGQSVRAPGQAPAPSPPPPLGRPLGMSFGQSRQRAFLYSFSLPFFFF